MRAMTVSPAVTGSPTSSTIRRIRPGTGADTRWFEIEPCYVFHVLNAFEEDGVITLDVARYADMWRDDVDVFPSATLHRYRIDLDAGEVGETALDDRPVEFPRVDPRRELPAEPSESDDDSLTSLAGNLFGLPEAVRISIALGEDPEEIARRSVSSGRSSARDGAADQDSAPMVFQTVVHLNLADRASRLSSDSSTEDGDGSSDGSDTSSTNG